MHDPVLLAGGPPVLTAAIAAEYLSATDVDIMVLDGSTVDNRARVEELLTSWSGRPPNRRLRAAATPRQAGRVAVVWCLAGLAETSLARTAATTRELLTGLETLHARRFCYAGPARLATHGTIGEEPWDPALPAPTAAAAAYRALESEVVGRCRAADVDARVVRLDPVVEPGHPDHCGGPLARLVDAVSAVMAELDERWPEYLRDQPLRLHAAPAATIGTLAARPTAAMLRSIGDAPFPVPYANLVTSRGPSVAEVCRRVGMTFDVQLTTLANRSALNPIDRMLGARLGDVADALARPAPDFRRDAAITAGGDDPDRFSLDGTDVALLAASARAASAGRRARGWSEPLRAVEAVAPDGAPLRYLCAGRQGPPLVLITALGHGAACWRRLIDRLLPRRVVTWQPRGVYEPVPTASTLADQVDDLTAILAHERIGSCHLVCWCTGPRVAIDFLARRPDAVASMVFLNGSFKALDVNDGLDTPYERNLEFICRAVRREPHRARRLAELFGAQAGAAPDPGASGETLAAAVLRLVSAPLRDEVRRPFADPCTLQRYAGQLLDIWSRAPLLELDRIPVRTLCLGAEFDDVASPERFRRVAERIPHATHRQLIGAGHYALHDQADVVGDAISAFLDEA